MAYQVFSRVNGDADSDFRQWCDEHPLGFVLNTKYNPKPDYLVLHTVRCSSVLIAPSKKGTFEKNDNPFTASGYQKVCSDEPDEILAFCRGIGAHGPSKLCSKCNPGPSYTDLPLTELRALAQVSGSSQPICRKQTVMRYDRILAVRGFALRVAEGRCGLCEGPAPFQTEFGPFLEVHHINFLRDGGSDTIQNVIALCPNCHRRVHSLPESSATKSLIKLALARAKLG